MNKLANLFPDRPWKGRAVEFVFFLLVCLALYMPIATDEFFLVEVVVGTILVGILFLMAIHHDSGFEITKTGYVMLVCEALIGMSFFLWGIVFRVKGYLAIGVIFCIVIPAIQTALAQRSSKEVLLRFSRGIEYSYWTFLIMTVLFAPPISSATYFAQYASVLGNPNTLGNYLIVAFGAFGYLMLAEERSFKRFLVCLAELVSVIYFALLSGSRTGVLAIIFEAAYFLVYIALTAKKKGYFKNFGKKFVAVVLVSAAVVVVQGFMITTFKTMANDALGDSGFHFGILQEGQHSKFTKGLDEGDVETFTSGRTVIWSDFLEVVEPKGHAEEMIYVPEFGKMYGAHNVYIQIAYSAGAPAGIVSLLLAVAAGWWMLRYLIGCFRDRGRITAERTGAAAFGVGFLIMSLVSGGYMFIVYLPTTMFLLTASVYMFKE